MSLFLNLPDSLSPINAVKYFQLFVIILYVLLLPLISHPDNEPSYLSHIGISMNGFKLRGTVVDSIRMKIEIA